MGFTGVITDISNNIITGKVNITFSVNEKLSILQEYEKLKNCKKLKISLAPYHEKRSLDANAYAWAIMSKIAKALKTDEDSIYELMLQKYGTHYTDDNGASEKITVSSHINVSKFGIHTKFIGHGYVGGKEFSHYIVIKGTSEYDTKEMSDFIDGVVCEAKELGIETITPDELTRMKSMWGTK